MSPLDLAHLRVVCDWIQYKKNFREPVEARPIVAVRTAKKLEIAVDLRALRRRLDAALTRALKRALARTARPGLLEPWGRPATAASGASTRSTGRPCSDWEEVTGREYEQALPGGESDARNTAAARETILELFGIWDELAARRALPDQLHVLELGVGNGNQARVWLDEFVELDREHGRDYYRRLHYLMGDYSPHRARTARGRAVAHHGDHVSALFSTRPSRR